MTYVKYYIDFFTAFKTFISSHNTSMFSGEKSGETPDVPSATEESAVQYLLDTIRRFDQRFDLSRPPGVSESVASDMRQLFAQKATCDFDREFRDRLPPDQLTKFKTLLYDGFITPTLRSENINQNGDHGQIDADATCQSPRAGQQGFDLIIIKY